MLLTIPFLWNSLHIARANFPPAVHTASNKFEIVQKPHHTRAIKRPFCSAPKGRAHWPKRAQIRAVKTGGLKLRYRPVARSRHRHPEKSRKIETLAAHKGRLISGEARGCQRNGDLSLLSARFRAIAPRRRRSVRRASHPRRPWGRGPAFDLISLLTRACLPGPR